MEKLTATGLPKREADAVKALIAAKAVCNAIMRGEKISPIALANGVAPQINAALDALMEPEEEAVRKPQA